MRVILLVLFVFVLSGCYTLTNNKIIVIPKHDEPVVVEAYAKMRCVDYYLFYSCTLNLSVKSSTGQKSSDFPMEN